MANVGEINQEGVQVIQEGAENQAEVAEASLPAAAKVRDLWVYA